ncbi:MAG TPA: amidohydrolase [Rhodothermales bacterium]|nr:amidohydrolase [Rhodothermales bacterium]
MRFLLTLALFVLATPVVLAQSGPNARDLPTRIDALAAQVEARVIQWRRHIHQHPELSNRETQTAAYVADHLRRLGLEVETGVARTGVVGVLRGGRPGPVVALRADMDALPVTEQVDVPFASRVRAVYNGLDVGVMHACGHDAHVAILMGVAEVLSSVKADLPGTVKFIFQPAEEGAPAGEAPAGAELMVREGVLTKAPAPEAIFGLHVTPKYTTGQVAASAGGIYASVDDLRIVVHGRQTHGAYPWLGIDPITTAAQVALGLQMIPARQMEATKAPSLVTIGRIDGGVRSNIIPDSVLMIGTIRALDDSMRAELHRRIQRTTTNIAEAAGARADVYIGRESSYPVTANDAGLLDRMRPTLARTVGTGLVPEEPTLGAEDFSFFAQRIPGLYVQLGIRPEGASLLEYPSNHSPRFRVDERALVLGVRTLAHLATDYLRGTGAR